jgi:hypothetical protein
MRHYGLQDAGASLIVTAEQSLNAIENGRLCNNSGRGENDSKRKSREKCALDGKSGVKQLQSRHRPFEVGSRSAAYPSRPGLRLR